MPPTVQNNGTTVEKRAPPKPGERKSELVCKVKYCNTLPDIPFDLKFIAYPFESTRFIQYNPTSLERNYRYEVLTEHDLGVSIDLINKDIYAIEPGAYLDPADEKLLEEDILTPQDSKRSKHHARSVSWLRRTEYISTEQTRFQPQTMDKVEAKVGYSIKKNLKNETLYMDRDSQIKAIEKTFEDSKVPIERHYSKPNVTPVEVMPIYPDFKLWKFPCAQVIFDTDPAPVGKLVPVQLEEMSQAMIRGVMDESGEQFVAYFLPTDETLRRRREDATAGRPYEDEQEYEYKMAREYNWNVKSKASKGYEENYYLVVRPDAVYYNELETRVRLSKRRLPASVTGHVASTQSNTRLVVQHRPMEGQEFRMQRYRERQLEPPGEGDDEEDAGAAGMLEEVEEEGVPEEIQPDEDGADKDGKKSGDEGSSDGEHSRSRSGSRSRASSRSSKRSKSASRSRSRSRSASGSRSYSRSKSRSRSRSKSRSRSRSASGSRSGSGSRSHSVSRSRSRSRSSRSGSGSRSGSESRSGSRSGSDSGGKSDSN